MVEGPEAQRRRARLREIAGWLLRIGIDIAVELLRGKGI
jgi:hypothetical protein